MRGVSVLIAVGWCGLAGVVYHQLRVVQAHPRASAWGYRTPDGRCWSPFVPTTNAVEQPETPRQQAVKPLYAIHVACP